MLEGSARELNAIFFSPRLMASRFNFLSPRYYLKLHPFARKEALRSAFQLAGTVSTLLALASRVPGVTVNLNPTNPNWGKIRIGNTRIDLAGGFQPQLRLLAQLATGRSTSSTTGKTREPDFRQVRAADEALQGGGLLRREGVAGRGPRHRLAARVDPDRAEDHVGIGGVNG